MKTKLIEVLDKLSEKQIEFLYYFAKKLFDV